MLVCRQLYIRAYIANFLKYHRTRERFYISGKIEEKKKERMEEEIKKKILDHLHEFNVTQIINCFLRDSSKYYTKEQDKEEVGKKFCPFYDHFIIILIVVHRRSSAAHRNT